MARLLIFFQDEDIWINYPLGVKPENGDLIGIPSFASDEELNEAYQTDGWDQIYVKLRDVHLERSDDGEVHWCSFCDLANGIGR